MDVSELWVYPVKGCRGIRVARAEVGARGFVGDRRWMIVDLGDRFVTQREEPRLARISTTLSDDALELGAPSAAPLRLPRELREGPAREVTVWGSRVRSVEHRAGGAWLSAVLERPLRLVFMPEDSRRSIDAKYARPGEIVSFADAFPVLVIGQGSLDDLNARLASPVDMRRFRPSLVVRGAAPFAEDGWATLSAGTVELRLVKRCSRCVVPTRDPETGEAGVEPLRTLARYRELDGKTMFGMNAIPNRTGALRVGDSAVCSLP